MTYNIHPIFVHFPIALLCVYSLIRVVPFHRWFPSVSWKHIERALLFFGVLGAGASLYTGEIAEHLVKPPRDIVEMHAGFAVATTWIYGALLLGEILSMWKTLSAKFSFLVVVANILTHRVFGRVLAIAGFAAITITGLLGGVLVYGLSADPFAAIVLRWLGLEH